MLLTLALGLSQLKNRFLLGSLWIRTCCASVLSRLPSLFFSAVTLRSSTEHCLFRAHIATSSFLNGRRLGSFGERWYFCRCLFYDRRFRYASIRLRSNLSPILVCLICETLRRTRLYRVHVSWRTHRGGVARPPPEQLAGVVEEDPQDLQLVSWRSVEIHRRANLLPRRSRMAY